MENISFAKIVEKYLEDENSRISLYYKIMVQELEIINGILRRLDELITKQTFSSLTYDESQEIENLEYQVEDYRKKKGKL